MSLSAAIIRELVAAGLAGEALVQACERIEAAQPAERTARQDRNARYYDARKERLKASENRLKTSYSDVTPSPLDPPFEGFPAPLPKNPPIIPPPSPSLRSVVDIPAREKSENPIAAFAGVLSDENARAVVEHRKAKGAKLTMRAAQLLAKAFDATGDPNHAAETMIAHGWQGFRPEWMESNDRTRTTTIRSSARESVTAFADGWRQGLPGQTDY